MENFDNDEILYIIAKLSKYYNIETVEYLKSLANLEISVLNKNECNKEFNEEFGNVYDFLKVAMYNIVYRAVNTVKTIDNIPFYKDKLSIETSLGDLTVFYNGNNMDDKFSLLSTNFKNDGKQVELPHIIVQQIDTIKPGNKTQSLRTLSNLRRDLTNETTKVLLKDWDIEFTAEDRKLFSKQYKKSLNWIDISKTIL